MPGEVVVKLKAVSGKRGSNAPSTDSLQQKMLSFGPVSISPAFNLKKRDAVRSLSNDRGLGNVDPGLYQKITFDESVDIETILSVCRQDSTVEYAEPNFIRRPSGEPAPVSKSATRSASATRGGLPSSDLDPEMATQWHLDSIQASQAWSFLQSKGINPGGRHDVIVAVIDSGVDYNHPDLAGNMWVNTAEVPGNKRDDDGNGFVDDIHGVTVTGSSSNHNGDPMDDHGHGTHVAGIACAQGNNNEGIVGVAFNAQIMAIKAAQYSGVLTSADIAEGILYAVDKGADVINMSFGGASESQIEKDALAIAFGQAVLVAAAGNDGVPNESVWNCPPPQAIYPAAYPWVLGVMAQSRVTSGERLTSFSNWDVMAENSIEYELMAPGQDIHSTLPGGEYGAWNGTSMAAPVVSGLAALLRSYYADKASYSSRFIMGQLARTGPMLLGKTVPSSGKSFSYRALNAEAAMNSTPTPKLAYLQSWIWDRQSVSDANDGDGRLDAGETVELALELRNHWGKADEVTVTLRPWNGVSATDDPYVSIDTGTVDYGAVGSFSNDDNGLVRDENLEITGVTHPFTLTVAADCPNDHVVPIQVTMTCKNGFAPEDPPLTFVSRFTLTVENGVELPKFIDTDTVLTKDKLYIVSDAVLVKEGVTLTIEAGTQVQFWSSNPKAPYSTEPDAKLLVAGTLKVQGTAEEPVRLFPSGLHSDRRVVIEDDTGSVLEFQYARISNPYILASRGEFDHCYFDQVNEYLSHDIAGKWYPYAGPEVRAKAISNSYFSKLGCYYKSSINPLVLGSGKLENNIFDSCYMSDYRSPDAVRGNVFLKNAKNIDGQIKRSAISKWGLRIDGEKALAPVYPRYREETDTTYFLVGVENSIDPGPAILEFELAEAFANRLGGHIACITDQAEFDFARIGYGTLDATNFKIMYPNLDKRDYSDGYTDVIFPVIGLHDWNGEFEWVSGEPVTDFVAGKWASGQPSKSGLGTFASLSSFYFFYDQTSLYRPVLIEIPGEYTQAQLDTLHQQHILGVLAEIHPWQSNAILNNWNDPDPQHWLKFETTAGSTIASSKYHCLSGNYWGTRSRTLIDASINDFYDDFKRPQLMVEPMLESAPENCYPFADTVVVANSAGTNVTTVGMETVTFTVRFNRDMSTAKQPQVSFGPAEPFTDFAVQPLEDGWVDPDSTGRSRAWRGTFDVTPVTGDGVQKIRVAGAVAADDPWLVTGDDSERFQFEIITSGVNAMALQASGKEGRVELTWFQDDFDLLAGYNIYRSSSQDGTYSRLNSSVIHKSQLSYIDKGLMPGKPYYYTFTVVKTDLTESGFSNVAAGTPVDTIPPVMSHAAVVSTRPGVALQIYADITDNVDVSGATLFYRHSSASAYSQLALVNATGNRYSAAIPGREVTMPFLEYYLSATDGISTVFSGSPAAPHRVTVNDAPMVSSVVPQSGSFAGETFVTISGSNFIEGATVTFGGNLATEIVTISANQLTCKAPPHFPAVVDVTVTNPGGSQASKYAAYTYQSSGVSLELPRIVASTGDTVQIPLTVGQAQGILSADFTLEYDAEVLTIESIAAGSAAGSFTVVSNPSEAGRAVVSMSSAMAFSGTGEMVAIRARITGNPGTVSPLTLSEVSLNSGHVLPDLVAGSVQVENTYSISGTCRYYSNDNPVSGVQLLLDGDTDYSAMSDEAGEFTLATVKSGAYNLTASRADDASETITVMDAVKVLQTSVGLTDLTDNERIAADVDRNGRVDALDASYILRHVVKLQDLPFPGGGEIWHFTPAQKTYGNLGSNQNSQDFTGILIGDVNGSWNLAARGRRSAPPSRGDAAGLVMVNSTSLPGNQEDDVTFEVELVNPDGLLGVEAELRYDPGTLEYVAVEKSSLSASMLLVANQVEAGTILIGMAGAEGIVEKGIPFRVRFRAKGDLIEPPEVKLAKLILNDTRQANNLDATGVAVGTHVVLKPGWNLFSVPIESSLAVSSLMALDANQDLPPYSFWTWTENGYVTLPGTGTFSAQKAYWVYSASEQNTSLFLQGNITWNKYATLSPGWNMVGPALDMECPSACSGLVWGWDGSKYVMVDSASAENRALYKTQGYWMFNTASEPVDLDLWGDTSQR